MENNAIIWCTTHQQDLNKCIDSKFFKTDNKPEESKRGGLKEIRDYIFHIHDFHVINLSEKVKQYNNFEMPISKRVDIIRSNEDELNKFVKWYNQQKSK